MSSHPHRPRPWPKVPEALPYPVTDNHCHLPLTLEEIPLAEGERLPLVQQLAQAESSGVTRMISSGAMLPDLAPTLALTKDFPQVRAALALHPNEVALHAGIREIAPDGLEQKPQEHHQVSLATALETLAELLREPGVVAVGESGLDYFRTAEGGRTIQKEAFRAHIALAKEMDLPLQIHDREAHADTIELLLKEGAPKRTVFHCFSGDVEMARVLAENGWYASFAGPITFPKNLGLRQALAELPRNLVLVETDAPYLTPQPFRGCPNASYMMPYTVRQIAQIWDSDLTESCQTLAQSTAEVYGTW